MNRRRILFISKGIHSVSTRYRGQAFSDLLSQDGWQAVFIDASGSAFNKINTLKQAARSDVVVIIRKSFPQLYLKALRKVSNYLIYDFDDAIFSNPDGNISSTRQARFIANLSTADMVWAGNHYLAHAARQLHNNVHILPTAVDTKNYRERPKKNNDSFDLVWIGSSSTSKYILQAIPWLEKAAEHIPKLRLKIIADFTPKHNTKLQIVPIQWSGDIEAVELASAHIGVAPMPDNTWTEGKCGLKIIQYMASSLPIIASAVGVNKEIVIDQVTGYSIANPEQFSDRIITLYKQPALMNTMAQKGYERFLEKYSLPAVYSTMQSLLKSIERT